MTVPALSAQSFAVVFMKPLPLQSFLPLQSLLADLQALLPLHSLTPWHSTLPPLACARVGAAVANSPATDAAIIAPLIVMLSPRGWCVCECSTPRTEPRFRVRRRCIDARPVGPIIFEGPLGAGY